MSLEENISQLNEDAVKQAEITNNLLEEDALKASKLDANPGDPPPKKQIFKDNARELALESSKRFKIAFS